MNQPRLAASHRALDPTPVPGPQPDENDGLDLARFVEAIRRRAWLVALSALAAVMVAGYVLSTTTPHYESSAEMLLGRQGGTDRTSRDLFEERSFNDSAIQGELAILGSTALLARVAERLDLGSNPEFNRALLPEEEPNVLVEGLKGIVKSVLLLNRSEPEEDGDEDATEDGRPDPVRDAAAAAEESLGELGGTVDALRQSIYVRQRGSSFVVAVTAYSEDPVTAAAIANAMVEEYISFTSDRRFEAATRFTGWLEARVSELAETVQESESAVLSFRVEVDSDVDNADRLAQQMDEMTTKLVDARADHAAIEAQAVEARNLLATRGAMEAAGILSSPALEELNAQVADLRREEAATAERFGDDSAQVAAIRRDLDATRAEIETEVVRVIAELDNQSTVQSINVSALRDALAELGQTAVNRSKSEIELNQLERVADANRLVYEDFLGRFKQSSEIQNLRRSDAEVVSYASPAEEPSTPRTRPTLVLALVAGILLSIGAILLLELRPKRVASPQQLAQATGLPVLGTIPDVGRPLTSAQLNRALDDPRKARRADGVEAAFRSLELGLGRPVRSALVVSDESGGDATAVTMLLGWAAARRGRRCLLFDANVARAELSRRCGASEGPTLLDVLDGAVPLEEAVRHDPHLDVWVLPTAISALDPAILFATPRADDLFREVVAAFDTVLVDAPSFRSSSDVVTFESEVDLALYAVARGRTRLRRLIDRLPLFWTIRSRLSGAIMSGKLPGRRGFAEG